MRYPLVFGFRDLISGNGFLARVAVSGRAIAEEDEQETWIYGVNPGGIAADAPTLGDAFGAFKRAYLSVLFDLAEESGSFKEFKDAVEAFFYETNEPTATEWKEAVELVRSGQLTAEGLKKVSATQPPSIVVEEPEMNPAANELDEPLQVAA